MLKIDLRRLILLLASCTALLSISCLLYGAYKIERELLIQESLESNRAYALKQAESTSNLLQLLQQNLAYSAKIIEENFGNQRTLTVEAERLLKQSNSFNSTFVLDKNAIIQAFSPIGRAEVGTKLRSSGVQQAILTQHPFISTPYTGQLGNLVILMSHPIFHNGEYQGLIGGTLYLQDRNSLSNILSSHYHRDGSITYAIDAQNNILYHPNTSLVGQPLSEPIVRDFLNDAKCANERLLKSDNYDELVGYATVHNVNWRIAVSRPTQHVLNELNILMKKVVATTLPFIFLLISVIWYLANFISTPLHRLAISARGLDQPDAAQKINIVNAWYFEAEQIKKSMLRSAGSVNVKFEKLENERMTDPLTGLQNRRSMLETVNSWTQQQRGFALVLYDIDLFKRVNDTYGHAVGDLVLQHFAQRLTQLSRQHDAVFRIGGEEFLVLLPTTDAAQAIVIANRLREDIARQPNPTNESITVSAGVSIWTPGGDTFEQALEQADQALYTAKRNGRNQVHAATTPQSPPSEA